MKTTDKQTVNLLVQTCIQAELKNVIFSPGSRNAPLVIGFHAKDYFEIETIADERVAAFTALGQAISTRKASIICCTSGSAVLNYAPAIVEAYYQKVPMLVVTADRPADRIDQGIGQSMRQHEVYRNYIKASTSLNGRISSDEQLDVYKEKLVDIINTITTGNPGPVHINIHFEEPLYLKDECINYSIPSINKEKVHLPDQLSLKDKWLNAKKKVVIAGLMPVDENVRVKLKKLTDQGDIILLHETTSNLYNGTNTIACLDRVLEYIGDSDKFRPDLLISLGGPIVSKKIKSFFSKHKPDAHWFVDSEKLLDTYRSEPTLVQCSTLDFLELIEDTPSPNQGTFQVLWQDAKEASKHKHNHFLSQTIYSDLKVMQSILEHLPGGSVLHLGNSTPVRYAQLFDQRNDIVFYSNRGVSGIDGSTSTAIGFAKQTNKKNYLITGDVAFFYDSNAFWQSKLPSNLIVILINNGGGGIFRFIPGPDSTDQLESVFESRHEMTAVHLCNQYGLEYKSITHENFSNDLPSFLLHGKKLRLIEVFTPREKNAIILRQYFETLRLHS